MKESTKKQRVEENYEERKKQTHRPTSAVVTALLKI
jgi:hypothetical protein